MAEHGRSIRREPHVLCLHSRQSHSGTLYIGVTNDLVRRISEHRDGVVPGFTGRNHVTLLVHFEVFEDIDAAILREKQLKGWNRAWKVRLIERENPNRDDLCPALVGGR
jgi:putative endonuclease